MTSSTLDETDKHQVEHLQWAIVAGITDGGRHMGDNVDATAIISGRGRKSDKRVSLLSSVRLHQMIDEGYGDNHGKTDDYDPSTRKGVDNQTHTKPEVEVSTYTLRRSVPLSTTDSLDEERGVPDETTKVDFVDGLFVACDDDECLSYFDLTVHEDDNDDNVSTLTGDSKPLPRKRSQESREARRTVIADKHRYSALSSRLADRFDKRCRLRSTDPADPNDVPSFDMRVLLQQAGGANSEMTQELGSSLTVCL